MLDTYDRKLALRLTLIKEGGIGHRLVKAHLAPFMVVLIPQLTETRKREIRSDDNARGDSLLWACIGTPGIKFFGQV